MIKKPLISIITPCFNEEDNIKFCIESVQEVMETLKDKYEYEHIFSDNSSTDNTKIEILNQISKNKSVKLIVNSHNVGPFLNNYNALKYVSGDYVLVFLPADLQDPPGIIPLMLEKIQDTEIVLGVRKLREEKLYLRLFRQAFYRINNLFKDYKTPIGAGEFMLITKKIKDIILNSSSDVPYIRGLVAKLNFEKSLVEYTWKKRKFGKTKNSFSNLVDQSINAFILTAEKPLRYINYFSILSFIFSFVFILYNVFSYYMYGSQTVRGINLVIVLVLFFGSLILLILGIIGEYILAINKKINKSLELTVIEKYNI